MNFLFKKNLIKMNYFSSILLIFLLFYFFILFSTYIFQRNLLYHPGENNYFGDPLEVTIEKVKIKTHDKIELLAWYHKKNLKGIKTLLFLHGNAGSLENRIHKINHFKDMNINFLIIAWRGFSGNKGKPTEKGLYEDARSAVRWLESKGIKENDIIIYGESLGTGVAIEVAQKYPGLSLSVFDLPQVEQSASLRFKSEALGDRIRFIPGSFRDDSLPQGYDSISLIRVLYDHSDDTVTKLLKKVYDALPIGGQLMISEPMSGGDHPNRSGDVYFAFYTMAMRTGKARSANQISQMCLSAGFSNIKIPRAPRPFITSSVLCVK